MSGYLRKEGYTLVCASLISDITCVIPVDPFDYVMEGTLPSNKRLHCSVYTYKDKNLSYTEAHMLDDGMLKFFKESNYLHRVESHIYEKGSHALTDGLNEMNGIIEFIEKW